jgi:hypothetical protein
VNRRLLDTFCCAGGAAMGYHRAGFTVVGVDIEPQPYYPFEFIQADALDVLADREFLSGFDAIHASPVCKTFARVTAWRGDRSNHPDTLTPTLRLLESAAAPWVAENVPEACPPLRGDLLLCGSQFGLEIKRHRAFQFGNWSIPYGLMPPCDCGRARPFMHKQERAYADAMGCTWMPKESARQAVPPAYTEYIGHQLMTALEVAA